MNTQKNAGEYNEAGAIFGISDISLLTNEHKNAIKKKIMEVVFAAGEAPQN